MKRMSTKGIVCIVLSVLLLVILAGLGAYEYWLYRQPKFHDVTIELGTDTLSITDFMTEYARLKRAAFVTNPGEIDLNRVGTTDIVFRHGKKEETVSLTIQDTTPPRATIVGEWTAAVNDLPELSDLVSEVKDMSETKVYFAEEPALTENYADQLLTIVVEDASGNKTEGTCRLSFRWMAESITLELGTELTRDMLLLDPERDEALLDGEELDKINSAETGTYTVLSITPAQQNICVVTVQDTVGPELVLKEVQRLKGKKVRMEDFIESVSDLSDVAEVRLLSEFDINTPENYTIVIEAEDTVGNITRAETILHVTTDITPPEFKGKLKAMTVAKHSSPDFLAGVTAEDKVDGPCKVTVDTSKLNIDKAGTYYITYKASDKSGNVKTLKRKVIVEHDAEDTAALVKEIADSLGNDPEKLRNYVRSKINYSHDWGGSDPVWYGFTTKNGNCYVHAMCLKAIFDLKGIENQLIWVTNKSHYWLIVKIDGKWKHIDPTPSNLHGRYSLMNDEQRLSTLSGRTWDTSKWPACE